jgi:hypothetical protein
VIRLKEDAKLRYKIDNPVTLADFDHASFIAVGRMDVKFRSCKCSDISNVQVSGASDITPSVIRHKTLGQAFDQLTVFLSVWIFSHRQCSYAM